MPLFNYSTLLGTPNGGDFLAPPFVVIPKRASDVPLPYYQGVSRLYLLSNDVYGSPHYEQLILLANPEWVSEHDIPDGTMLRVPYPLENVLQDLVLAQSNWYGKEPLNH